MENESENWQVNAGRSSLVGSDREKANSTAVVWPLIVTHTGKSFT